MTTGRWIENAKCKGMPSGWWFPASHGNYGQALEICISCPVRVACLEDALKDESCGTARYGMRGGVKPEDREELVTGKRARRARHGTDSKYCAGCKCDECRASHAEAERNRVARRRRNAG